MVGLRSRVVLTWADRAPSSFCVLVWVCWRPMQTLRGADRSSVCDSTDASRSGSVSESAAPSGRHPEATEPGLSWLFAKYGQWPFRKSGRRCLVLGPKSAPQVKREEHTHVYVGTRHPHTCVHAHTCVHTRTCLHTHPTCVYMRTRHLHAAPTHPTCVRGHTSMHTCAPHTHLHAHR